MAEEAGVPEAGAVTEPEKYVDRHGEIWTENLDPGSVGYKKFALPNSKFYYTLKTVQDSHGPIHRVSKCPECGRWIQERPDGTLRMHRRPGPPSGWPKIWCPKGAPQ